MRASYCYLTYFSLKSTSVTVSLFSLKLNLSFFKYWTIGERLFKVAPDLLFLFSQTILAAFYRVERELLLFLH